MVSLMLVIDRCFFVCIRRYLSLSDFAYSLNSVSV